LRCLDAAAVVQKSRFIYADRPKHIWYTVLLNTTTKIVNWKRIEMMKGANSLEEEAGFKELLRIIEEKGRAAFEAARKAISEEKILSGKVREALDYYSANLWFDVHHAGFLSLACEAVGGKPYRTTLTGAAMILLRAGIDVHDDIIDEQKTKAGKMTVYGKYGSEIAILSGNALLFKGFALMNEAVASFSRRIREKVVDLAKNAFFEIGDAVACELELRDSANVLPQDYYNRVVRRKAVGVEVHIEIGALLGNGTCEELEQLSQFGRVLGIVTVVRDELVDAYEPAELQDRLQNEVAPLTLLYALQDAHAKEKINRLLRKKKLSETDAQKILELMFESEGYQRFKKDLQISVRNSMRPFSHLKETKAKETLRLLVSALMKDL
jgi:geranylgeranyl pyrophosphate synthase